MMPDKKCDELLETTLTSIAKDTPTEFNEARERFDAHNDVMDRYNALKQVEKRLKKVEKPQGIVVDAEAIAETMKTFKMINNKLQDNIAEGVDPSPNDIKLLIEMLKALNGDK